MFSFRGWLVKRITLLLILAFCFQGLIFAQEKANVEDRIVGLSFKSLAKAFVAISDIDKVKKNNIDKLKKINEDKFKQRYVKVYRIIKDLPVELKVKYGITEAMTKERVIKDVESLDKNKTYEIIDAIPDAIIAEQFKEYLREKKQEIQKSSLIEQINMFWNKITEKVKAIPVSKSFSN